MDKNDGLLLGFERTFQLGVLHGCQNPLKSGSWLKTHSPEIVTGDQSRWARLRRRSGREEILDRLIGIQTAVTCGAIQAVKLQVFGKPGLTNEPLQSGLPHLRYIFKLHVIRHKSFYLLGFLIGKPQTTADCLSHANADVHMSIKTNPIACLRGWAESGRLSDVMKKNAPGETRR